MIKNKWHAGAISAIIMIPFQLLINIILAKTIKEPIIDIWDIFSYVSFIALAVGLYLAGSKKRK